MTHKLDTVGAWLLGLIWVLPLAYTLWAAFHPSADGTKTCSPRQRITNDDRRRFQFMAR